ncbi:hypothetical protein OG381_47235 [Streptomyces sp. NBC_00490]
MDDFAREFAANVLSGLTVTTLSLTTQWLWARIRHRGHTPPPDTDDSPHP